MKLLVLDGNSIVNRAYYGIKLLTTKDGIYTNGIFGFLNILNTLLRDYQPDEVAIAFDVKQPTFRHKMYDGYKATRHGMPQELAQQMPILKELLEDLGFVLVECPGWEADDILGTLAAACAARKDDCLLSTGDRDSLQLVSDTTTVLLASTRMGKSETVVMDVDAVQEKYGLSPKQLIDVKSLMGDTSDNIPGVAGIGEKTALSLIQKFGSLDGVYAHLEDSFIKPGQRAKLTAGEESARLSYTLGTIATDAPIPTEEGSYLRRPGNPAAAAQLLARLEMHTMVTRWGLDQEAASLPQDQEEELPHVSCCTLDSFQGEWCLARQDDRWFAVQGQTLVELDRDCLPALLDSSCKLRVFDSKPLYRMALEAGGIGESILFDGKLAAYLLNPSAAGYQPDQLAAEYGVKARFVSEEYPLAGCLEELLDVLDSKLKECGMEELLHTIELPLARVLADMERLGFLVDAQGIRDFGKVLEGEIQASLDRIYQAVGYSFNVNSPIQLGKALFEDLGLPPRKKTKRGYSTDAETLESLLPYSQVVEDILHYRACAKLNSTYVEGLLKQIEPDGRVHSEFIQTETRTGRISSIEPNLQNIPIRTPLGSQMRGFFLAREGCLLADADYSQIELRILAHVSGDESMRQAFLSGADIHRSTAAKIYHIPPEEVTPDLRSGAKAINFGIMYGKGAFSLSKDLNVSVKEADAFLKEYLATFPRIDAYMNETIQQGREEGYVSTLFGRRRYLPELTSKNFQVRSSGERMARNTPIQGTAADIIKLAMVRVWERLRRENLEARLILQVHDELIVEAPEAEVEQVARILQEEMQGAVEFSVPLTVDVHTGKTWKEAH